LKTVLSTSVQKFASTMTQHISLFAITISCEEKKILKTNFGLKLKPLGTNCLLSKNVSAYAGRTETL